MGDESSRVLAKVVLGFSPVIDRYEGVIATRLTVVPLRVGVTPDVDALLQAIGEVWPEQGGPVVLNVSSELMLAELLRARPNRNVMVEIPWFVAAEPDNTGVLCELAARGNLLLLKGRPARELPREVLPCFKWALIDYADDRRLAAPAQAPSVARSIPHIQSGVRTMAQLQHSFERGAIAVIGWPLHEPVAPHTEARPDVAVVLELIEQIEQGRYGRTLDDTLMRDPLLAFELLRHVQAAAPGQLRLETGSFRQAISLLGEQPLRRWLGGMLARTGDDMRLRPVNFAALRRGLLMRQLASPASDAQRAASCSCAACSRCSTASSAGRWARRCRCWWCPSACARPSSTRADRSIRCWSWCVPSNRRARPRSAPPPMPPTWSRWRSTARC